MPSLLGMVTLVGCMIQYVSSSTSLPPIEPSLRSDIASFKVMDVLARAVELETEGRFDMICHMEAGQPSTPAPEKVLQRAAEALSVDRLGYTSSLGVMPLRIAIANHYLKKYGVTISPNRIIVTTGSSGAFLLSFLGFFDPGSPVALASAGYPCYRNIMSATGLSYVSIPVNAQYKVTAQELTLEIDRRRKEGILPLKGLILSSPSNPTGAMMSPEELKALCKVCDDNDIMFMSDEIYHGISYGYQKEASAVEFSERAVVINSFSKYFSMTGWRLGWMVVPEELIPAMNRLTQNIYINAPTLSQLAGIAAFDCEEELDANVARYAINREIVLSTLQELKLDSNVAPADGAFYIYADLSTAGVTDSAALCQRILEEAGVALTPGIDFEDPASGLGLRRLRFSFCRGTDEVREGMIRFKTWWEKNMRL